MKKKNTVLGIIALVVSFFGGLGFVGSLLGLMDLLKDKNKENKHTLAIVAIGIGLIMTCLSAGTDKTENTTSAKESKETAVQEDVKTEDGAAKTDKAEEKSETEEASAYTKGDTYDNGDVSITMTECGIADSSQIMAYTDVPDNCRIVYATFSAENVGSDSVIVSYTDFTGYADDTSCDGFYFLDENVGTSGLNFMDTLSAGRKTTGTVAFIVPEDAASFEIEYKPNFLLNDVVVFTVPLG